jgi:hypothetical protein
MLKTRMPTNTALKPGSKIQQLKSALVVLCLIGFVHTSLADDSAVKSAISLDKKAHITLVDGRKFDVALEPDQIGIEDIKVAPNSNTVGWLVLYPNPDGSHFDSLPGELVIWRGGKVRRRFDTDQVFYSWTFFRAGTQVTYHTGPTHGESTSHCELHNVSDGKLVEMWNGDLDGSAQQPDWVVPLKR